MARSTNEREGKVIFRKNLERYREKLKDTPEEDICEIAPEVGVPIAEKLSYVTNEELTEMYTELLAKASVYKKSNYAHPSFANVINNISPDEAIIIKSISKMRSIPFIEARLKKKDKHEWMTLNPMIPGIGCLGELQYSDNIQAYISNLEGLGLLSIKPDMFMVGDGIYEPLEEYATSIYSAKNYQVENSQLAFERG